MPDWFSTFAFAMGSAWLSGINLYATVATLGLLERWWIIGVAGALYFVEFFADKIPAVDSVWDVIHTFIRVPAGAVMAAAAFANTDNTVRIIALLSGGGIALSSHGTKAAVRMAANLSPEPFSNIALSVFEDVVAIGSSVLMVFLPIVMLVVVVVFLVVVIWLAPRIVRAARRRFSQTAASSG
jgi:hypothetical protein